ncbi:hypothetical protein [Serpentinicella alkaliphila]|uniref:Large polyvalent-protein-associated domain-containing protein n=1 Tax=Serpentinicella alkaliphila TaxID=1734049 RepID=A0A4R2T8I7_9FIRM|nr:hypothetical protein [Serpentinicella alkaliphila]QUH25753.1 hypothetical protein HZR23_08400 [Serpentinicella alkaliphila]TCP93498.1 hypothetical protein EDD79_10765 [Serpentinicella alkaliphila]
MRIQELAEALQPELEKGNMNYIIFQEGRQWKFEPYGTIDKIEDEDEKRFLTIRHRIDDKAIIVSGQDFDYYDLKYLQNQIKKLRK